MNCRECPALRINTTPETQLGKTSLQWISFVYYYQCFKRIAQYDSVKAISIMLCRKFKRLCQTMFLLPGFYRQIGAFPGGIQKEHCILHTQWNQSQSSSNAIIIYLTHCKFHMNYLPKRLSKQTASWYYLFPTHKILTRRLGRLDIYHILHTFKQVSQEKIEMGR